MIKKYIKSPLLLMEAQSIPHDSLQIFLTYLVENGYSPETIRQYIGAIVHFAKWQHQRGYSSTQLSIQDKTNFIKVHLTNCRCPAAFPRNRKTISAALSHWIRLVCQHPEALIKNTAHNELIKSYDQHLNNVAGLSEATRLYRCRYAMEFLNWLTEKASIALGDITLTHLSSFIIQRAKEVSLASTAVIACSLSCFIRFLSAHGRCSINVDICVPHPKLKYSLPSGKPLSIKELNKLMVAIDRSYPVGKRDYAVIRCLSDLGLRTCEVARLNLDNISWRTHTISLHCPKSRRQRKLPIPDTMMVALIDYLTKGRPKTRTRFVFVYHRAPLGKPVQTTTIRGIVRRAFARAGFSPSQSQVHRLRYTMVSQLLMNEVPLKTIADVLGHQSIETTIRYACLNREDLQDIPLPWPEGETL